MSAGLALVRDATDSSEVGLGPRSVVDGEWQVSNFDSGVEFSDANLVALDGAGLDVRLFDDTLDHDQGLGLNSESAWLLFLLTCSQAHRNGLGELEHLLGHLVFIFVSSDDHDTLQSLDLLPECQEDNLRAY